MITGKEVSSRSSQKKTLTRVRSRSFSPSEISKAHSENINDKFTGTHTSTEVAQLPQFSKYF